MTGRTARIAAAATAAVVISLEPGLALASAPPGWHIASTLGKPSGQTALANVVATGSASAWALGATGHSMLIERWNGHRWARVADPAGLPESGSIGSQSFGASSAADAWLLASNVAYHWTGKRWQHVSVPSWAARSNRSGQPNAALAVFSSHDVWYLSLDATSQPRLAGRYNGHKWVREQLPAEPAAVGWLSATNIWAIGEDTATRRIVAMHYDGHSWTTRNVPGPRQPSGALLPYGQGTGVAVISPDDVWFQELSQLWHFDNGRWSSAKIPEQGLSIAGIVQDGQGGVWVPTFGPAPASAGYLSHLSNGRWTKDRIPSQLGHQVEVAGLAWVPGTRSVWAVGAVPTGSPSSTTEEGIVLSYRP
jgi:hypothetical protein